MNVVTLIAEADGVPGWALGWAVIIGALIPGILQVLTLIQTNRVAKDVKAELKAAAVEVKADLRESNTERREATAEAKTMMEDQNQVLGGIHDATNSVAAKLNESIEKEALLRGANEERAIGEAKAADLVESNLRKAHQ